MIIVMTIIQIWGNSLTEVSPINLFISHSSTIIILILYNKFQNFGSIKEMRKARLIFSTHQSKLYTYPDQIKNGTRTNIYHSS